MFPIHSPKSKCFLLSDDREAQCLTSGGGLEILIREKLILNISVLSCIECWRNGEDASQRSMWFFDVRGAQGTDASPKEPPSHQRLKEPQPQIMNSEASDASRP